VVEQNKISVRPVREGGQKKLRAGDHSGASLRGRRQRQVFRETKVWRA